MKTRRHSSRMCTTCFGVHRWMSLLGSLSAVKPPPDRDPLPQRRNKGPESQTGSHNIPPGENMGPDSQTGSDIITPVNRQTGVKHYSPATSLAGGKNTH